jgi:predicted DNA-binding transcriptional regulator AlpA
MRALMANPTTAADPAATASSTGQANGFSRSFMSPQELADFLGISLGSVRNLDKEGEGPRSFRITRRRIGYRLQDIEEWLRAREVASAA